MIMTPEKLTPKQKVLTLLPEIEGMAMIACTDSEIAGVLSVSEATLKKYAAQPLARARNEMRQGLRRMQWERCKAGSDKMQIWLGQQYIGQRRESREQIIAAPPLYPEVPIEQEPENVVSDATDSGAADS